MGIENKRRHLLLGMLLYDHAVYPSEYCCVGSWRWMIETQEREGRKMRV